MSNEFDVRLGVQFVPGSAADQATAEANRIKQIFARMGEQLGTTGILDPKQAQRFGDELGKAIRAAMNQDLRSSPLLNQASAGARGAVQGTSPTATSNFLAEQIRVTKAELGKLLSVPQGQAGALGEQERKVVAGMVKELSSIQTLETANRQLVSATERYVTAQQRAFAQAEAQVAAGRRLTEADAAKNFPVSYPTAEPGTRLGRGEEAVNAAERTLAAAEIKRAQVYLSDARSAEQVLSAENKVENAARALATAQQRLADEQIRAARATNRTTGQQEQTGGIGSQFALGFRGVSDRPFAEQIGQAFKFSIFYGTAYKALFALTQTFQQTLQEGIQFQTAVSELRLATGRSAEAAKDLANEVGKEAASYGFAPSQGAQIAARAQGYYGTTDSTDRALQDAVGRTSSRVVNQLAFGSGKQPDDIQSNLAAITQAYGLGFQSQTFIGDLDSYFARKFGVQPGSTIGAVAESGTVGRAAGFAPAEVSAIAADIMARTGASESQTGGFLAQIFSRSGEGSLTNLAARYDINGQAPLADQFKQLAQVYATRPDQRDDISAAFGRGKVQNAVIALLQDYPRVLAASKQSVTEAPGALGRATDLRLDNIGGQIQQTVGSLREFANELGQSGLLDVLGGGVVMFRDLVEAGTQVLEVFNTLPRPVRDAAVAITALALAARLASAAQAEGSLGLGAGFLSRGGLSRASTLTGERALATAGGDVIPLASRAGVTTLGRGAIAGLGGYGVAAAVLGDAVLWSKFRAAQQNLTKGEEDFTAALATHTEDLNTPEGLQSRASTIAQAAADRKDQSKGFFASIYDLGDPAKQARADAALGQQESARLSAASKALAAKQAADAGSAPASAISGFDADSLSSSIQLITQAGGNAKTQFDALAQSIDASARAANRVSTFDPKSFASTNATGIFEGILKHPGFDVSTQPNGAGKFINSISPGNPLGKGSDLTAEIIRQSINPSDIQKRLQAALADIGDPAKLTSDQLTTIASEVVGNLPDQAIANSGGALDDYDRPAIQDALTGYVKSYLTDQFTKQNTALSAIVKLSGPELSAFVDQLSQSSAAALQALPQTDYKGRIDQAKALVEQIKKAIGQSDGATPEALAQLAAAQRGLAESTFDQLEATRKAAQQNAHSAGGVAAAGQSALRSEINAAIKGNDPDLLAKIIAQAGNEALTIARQAIQQAIAAARAAQALQVKAATLAAGVAGGDTGHGGSYAAVPSSNTGGLQALAGSLAGDVTAAPGSDVYQNGNDVPGGGAGANTAAAIGASAAQAHAAQVQGQIAKARADIVSAKAAMSDAGNNVVAYNEALAQYYQARQELTQAIIAYRSNLYLLGHDITDPLTQARAALKAAAAQLKADRGSGAAPDQLANDRVSVQEAQAAAESQKFQERLSAVQTADELGRISHQKYLAYLQHEHDRLGAVKDRTYQQQQELDQVDQLMKSAADAMQGEWNFGDIKLPTPYEVRRRVQETYGAAVGAATASNDYFAPAGGHNPATPTSIVNIDGSDIGMIKKILSEILGNRAVTVTTAPRHR